MAFLQFNVTVSAASIEINDLGGIVLTTGAGQDLGQRYQIEELRYSKDLAFHIHAGNATATDSVGRLIDNSGGATLAQVETRLNRAGHIFNTDELDEGSTNLYFTEAAARASIGIDPTSEQFMNYDENTGLLSVTNLLITSVDVDTVETSLSAWAAANYNTSLDYQEGDVIILTAATGGSQTWINNGGTALTEDDWTEIQGPDVSDAHIRSLISGSEPISYNNITGAISLLYDNDTVKINSAGEIYVDESALTGLQKTFANGLTETTGTVRLGGDLTGNTSIDGLDTYDLRFDNIESFNANSSNSTGSNSLNINNSEAALRWSNGTQTHTILAGTAGTSMEHWNGANVGTTGNFSYLYSPNAQAQVVVKNSSVDILNGDGVLAENTIQVRPENTIFSHQIQLGDIGGLHPGATEAAGMIRWNTSTTNFQGYNGTAWVNLDEQDTNTEYTAGDALTLTGTEFNVLYDNDTLKLNSAGELYVDLPAATPLTFENGLTEATGTVKLGGVLTGDTEIGGAGLYDLRIGKTGGKLGIFQVGTEKQDLLLNATETYLIQSEAGYINQFFMNGTSLQLFNNLGSDSVSLDMTNGTNIAFSNQIQVGNLHASATAAAGMIRWNATNFQGYNGTTWVNLDEQDTNTEYTAGTGLTLSGTVFSITDTAVTPGSYGSASEVATFTVNAQGQLTAAASTSISITASQVSDFNTATSTEIFEAANFVDGTTIDFTVTAGTSVTAEVTVGSLTEDYLSINTPSTGTPGDVLTSDGLGNFEWTDVATYTKKSWTWGAASNAINNTNRFLDRHDGAPTNLTPYVSWYNCELKALSLTQVGTVTWTAEVYVNGSSVATLSSGGSATTSTVLVTPVTISVGDTVSFYVNGTGVSRPAIDAFFETV
jgi:hypothetical protein